MSAWIKSKWFLLIWVTTIGLILDIVTKKMAVASLAIGQQVPVFGQYFSWLLVYNKGALFGIDPRHFIAGFPLNGFFFIFTGVAVLALLAYYFMVKKADRFLLAGLAIIMPGALGNFVDRISHQSRGVVDFIRLGISPEVYWPIFNFADIYLTFGIILIFVSMLREGKQTAANKKPVPESAS